LTVGSEDGFREGEYMPGRLKPLDVGGQRQALIKKLCIQFDEQLATAADELAPWPTRREDGGHKPPS
jgi:hypothetical protein